jgi:nitrite reductase (cytochrome c-552)
MRFLRLSTRSSQRLAAVVGLAVLLAVVVTLTLVVYENVQEPSGEAPKVPPLAQDERDPAVFGQVYPRHYDLYAKMADTSRGPSRYGGSDKEDKLEAYPYMRTLFKGYGFSKEYTDDRGHVYSLEDVTQTQRVDPEKTAATCITCKSTQSPDIMARYGDEYFRMPFKTAAAEAQYPIGCPDCHDPQTMDLHLSRPALIEALERQGIDPNALSHQEMRTMVCAQCHVEYYFAEDTGRLTFPWDQGTDPEQMYAYYQALDFKDWEHPDAGVPELKAQHPDYEMFLGSSHEAAGLSCADCHMPFVVEGNTKLTSHWVTSPLKHMDESCSVCHRRDMDDLRERVFYTQDRTKDLLDRAGWANVAALEAIAAAEAAGVDPEAIEEARALQREAQWYWDWVSAENGMGFHNPQKAMNTLGRSIDLAHQARLKAELSRVLRALGLLAGA